MKSKTLIILLVFTIVVNVVLMIGNSIFKDYSIYFILALGLVLVIFLYRKFKDRPGMDKIKEIFKNPFKR